MGTLTASMPRLLEHCPHKLPTSCRLTSTPLCCACADKRPHSSAYRIYIDGIGFVYRGTRWQNYCWFCKVFWNNRLADTRPPLSASQTCVPEVPDQSPFLKAWWEFYDGYREIRRSDGTMERITLDQIHQPLEDAPPGQLPSWREGHAWEMDGCDNTGTFCPTHDDECPRRVSRPVVPAPPSSATEQPTLSIEEELDAMIQDLSTLPTEDSQHRSAFRANENWAHVFGTREDVERQGEEYQSPIGAMYARAWDRFTAAETERVDQRARTAQALRETAVPHESHYTYYDPGVGSSSQAHRDLLSAYNLIAEEDRGDVARTMLDLGVPCDDPTVTALLGRPRVGLDADDGRPAAKTDEEMTVKLSCRICYSQVADTAVVPCGHLAMCQWCADKAVPVAPNDKTRPVGSVRCPVCRGKVKRRFKIITV